jgi:hypothetical protein
MSPELDKGLVIKYPKIFANRYSDMSTTAMCWGFDCDDGWYNILDHACSLIQSHIDWNRNQRASALRYNRALERAVKGDRDALLYYFSRGEEVKEWHEKSVNEVLSDIEPQCRRVPDVCTQVVATQIKEKFGTLRFYYDGGDDYVDGIVRMAESMSSVTCETCGNPGTQTYGGWIKTLCDKHREEGES